MAVSNSKSQVHCGSSSSSALGKIEQKLNLFQMVRCKSVAVSCEIALILLLQRPSARKSLLSGCQCFVWSAYKLPGRCVSSYYLMALKAESWQVRSFFAACTSRWELAGTKSAGQPLSGGCDQSYTYIS